MITAQPVKVLFITQNDPIYVASFWDKFCKLWKKDGKNIRITGVVNLQPLGRAKPYDLLQRIFGMYGPLGTLKLSMKFTKAKFGKRNIKDYAQKLDSRYIRSNTVKSQDILDLARNADIVFSVAASLKFGSEILSAPKYGCYNIHSGPLPSYQGMMPVFWQMRDGKDHIGITIHRMDESIDTGEILKQEFADISECKSLDKAIRKTKIEGAEMVFNFLNGLYYFTDISEAGNKSKDEATYFSFPRRDDVKAFRNRGLRLI